MNDFESVLGMGTCLKESHANHSGNLRSKGLQTSCFLIFETTIQVPNTQNHNRKSRLMFFQMLENVFLSFQLTEMIPHTSHKESMLLGPPKISLFPKNRSAKWKSSVRPESGCVSNSNNKKIALSWFCNPEIGR